MEGNQILIRVASPLILLWWYHQCMAICMALSITLAVELFLLTFFYRKDHKAFFALSLANLILNPTMNVIALFIQQRLYYLIFIIAFTVATIFIEGYALFWTQKKRFQSCLLSSLVMNVASLVVWILCHFLAQNDVVTFILLVAFSLIYIGLLIYHVHSIIKQLREEKRHMDAPDVDRNASIKDEDARTNGL